MTGFEELRIRARTRLSRLWPFRDHMTKAAVRKASRDEGLKAEPSFSPNACDENLFPCRTQDARRPTSPHSLSAALSLATKPCAILAAIANAVRHKGKQCDAIAFLTRRRSKLLTLIVPTAKLVERPFAERGTPAFRMAPARLDLNRVGATSDLRAWVCAGNRVASAIPRD